jgi:hypothetical protein
VPRDIVPGRARRRGQHSEYLGAEMLAEMTVAGEPVRPEILAVARALERTLRACEERGADVAGVVAGLVAWAEGGVR